jgi:hypothetical protein
MKLYSLVNLIFLCIIVNGFFTFFGIFLNSVVIISLWRSAQLRKGTGNFMILVLSSFDLLVIIVGHPTVIYPLCLGQLAITVQYTGPHQEMMGIA